MARIPEAFIRELLDRTDIVGVIEGYIPLRRVGANYLALCPFHKEKTPSFTVSPSKQFYHCFGCGAHGTALTFLMEYAGLSFVDAVHELAGRLGLRVPEAAGPARPEDDRRERLLTLLAQADQYYRQTLRSSPQAIDYLKGRGLTGKSAAHFGLGYAPDEWQGLARAFGDYQDPLLEAAGLVIVGEQGRRYDRFRGRVMFPIRNERGQVIGFGGRVLGTGEPKYLNSPETPVFAKGRELYGLFEARRAIQQAGEVVVVEGYMDVVMLAQQGVDNAVATLGTAVTNEQVSRLMRLADSIVFAFDGDAAGRKAAWRALENSLPQLKDGKRVAFLFLPEGEDPDSYVRFHGVAAWRHLLASAIPLSDYLVETLSQRTELASQEGRVKLIKLAEPYLRQMTQAPILAGALRRRLAELTGLPADGRGHAGPARPTTLPAQPPRVRPSPWRTALLALLHDPKLAADVVNLPEGMGAEAQLFKALLETLHADPHLAHTRDVIAAFRGRPEQPALQRLAGDLLALGEDYDAAADLQAALDRLRQQARRRELEVLSRKPLAELTPEEQQRLRASLRDGKLPPEHGVKAP